MALDPNSAAARAVLADAYVGVSWMGGQQEPFLERARQAARRSLELDPNEATAHATLGIVLALFDWDTASGERELKRALELGPDVPAVLRFNSVFLWYVGRFEEASALNARELALDPTRPLSPTATRHTSSYYWRRYEDCIAQTLKTLELDRSAELDILVARQQLRAAGTRARGDRRGTSSRSPSTRSIRRMSRRCARPPPRGARSFWACNLDQVRGRPKADSAMLAWAHLKVGDHDQAIAWLERISERRGPWLHEIDLDLTGIRCERIHDSRRGGGRRTSSGALPEPRVSGSQALLRARRILADAFSGQTVAGSGGRGGPGARAGRPACERGSQSPTRGWRKTARSRSDGGKPSISLLPVLAHAVPALADRVQARVRPRGARSAPAP